jgi:acyl-coenzyme A synthetase/AMP-(fatty) acid ligase
VKPKAFVALRDGVAASDAGDRERLCRALQEHVKERLSKHKYPRWVILVDELPKNDRGKIDRKVLIDRERAGENPWH